MKLHPEYNDNQMVVAYYRYSSSSQNEASIEQQREMVHRWASSQGLIVVSEYEDAAKTGTNPERPGYQLMLRDLKKIKPAYVAVWKNDRLARDRAELLLAKQAIRAAGARVHYIEGISPTDSPDSVLMEGVADAFAEYYSLQLSANIRRGQRYNAERALSNGHKIFGFTVDTDKRYVPDPETAPIVGQIFDDYAHGVSMQKIADRLNAQGVRTTRGYRFTPKNLNKLLKNRAYIGEYAYGEFVIEDGMPRLVEDDVFDEVQRRFAINKRRGAKTKAELAAQGADAPDYWLTGRAYCLTCGGSMEGVSGTSKTGKTYRYYYCLNQRKKKCSAKTVRKDEIEVRIEEIVASFLADPKQAIRAAGARVHYIEGISPTDSPDSVLMEGVADAFAEYYSLQLSANIRRGQRYNAERALSNGHKIFGFTVDTDKRYVPDPETAPIVGQIFDDYAHGVSMQKIADRLNAQGVRTTRGYRFTPKNLNKLLKNRAYIGEYAYGEFVIEDGMPRLVEDDVFDEVQRRFAINKRRGAKTKAELAAQGADAPDYWLTGRAYCLTCGGSMEGVSGTSKTGKTYRYYYCLNQRKKKCSAKTVRKDEIEVRIEEIVASFLADPEMLASLAVDLADYYKKTHGRGDEILKALEARRADVEKKLANFVKAISQGIFNDTTAEAMRSLEEQKRELDAAIQAEHVKATLFEDEASIGAFYKRFAQATIDTPETREQLFEYFVDKIFIGRDQIIVASYYHDSAAPIEFEDLEDALTSGHRAGEVRTYARKREFDTSPSGGDAGNRTPVPRSPADTERGKCEPTLESESSTLPPQVEMRGIEPRSDGRPRSLLRAQSAVLFLSP